MTKTGWIGLMIIIVVLGGGLLWWDSAKAPATEEVPARASETPSVATNTALLGTATSTSDAATGATASAVVTYDGSTFSPPTVTIAQGGSVTFTDATGAMWIASNSHPTHTLFDGTSLSQHCAPGYAGPAPFDQCSPGSSYTFIFSKLGTWGYHDHLNHAAGGSVIVVAK